MMERLKLLLVVPSLRRAGAQTQLVQLINGMSKERYEVHLVTFERELDQLGRLPREVRFYNKPRRHRYDVLSVARFIAEVIDEQNIDLVHCTLHFALLLGWLGVRLSRRKPRLCSTVHTTLSVSRSEEIRVRLLYRWLLRSCEAVIFVCHRQREYWLSRFPELARKSCTIYNGIDTEHFAPATAESDGIALRNSLCIPQNTFVISCIARFRPEKGHRHLVKVFARLDNQPHLLLAGDGEEREEIERLVEKLGVARRVHFLGSVEDVRAVLSASNLTVLASTAVESFSIAMLESMAMGRPVIGTRIGGMAEAVFPNRTGNLVPPGDEEALYQALAQAVASPGHLAVMGRSARRLVEDQFGVDRMVRSTEDIFEQLVSAPGSLRYGMPRGT